MNSARKFSWLLLVPGLLIVGFASAWGQGSLPEGEGKEAIQASCTICHGLSYITGSALDADGWRDTIQDMYARGAPLKQGELEPAIRYLAANFGPDSPKASESAEASEGD